MIKSVYPILKRGADIEVGAPRRGRPGYRWVAGWIVQYSKDRESTPMRLTEARAELRRAKDEK